MPEKPSLPGVCRDREIKLRIGCYTYQCQDGQYIAVNDCDKICDNTTEVLVKENDDACCECRPISM